VALAEEKASYFQDVWQDMNIGVKAFHGDGGDSTGNILSEDVEVAVCTIERANILLTQLLDEGREDQLKMVVIDEIHMLADAQRGFLLEVMLSKIKYLLNDSVQIVGMSATLPNIADLAGWLDAALYTTQYRPVDLEVKVCLDRQLFRVTKAETPLVEADPPTEHSKTILSSQSTLAATADDNMSQITVSTLPASAACTPMIYMDPDVSLPVVAPGVSAAIASVVVEAPAIANYDYESLVGVLPEDPDGMKRLCLETVQSGKSAMLFCNSKRRCEVCATAVAESLAKHGSFVSGNASASAGSKVPAVSWNTAATTSSAQYVPLILSNATRAGRLAMVESLSQTQVGLCPVLRNSLPYGVAYHHAGLTLDERKIVEDGFRQGFVQVLCTTSTLSAGVNLPAHRVIIRCA
jgi:DNA polymerase theta